MGLLTFGLNVTLDGCIDHTQGIVDDELHDYWTQLMDQSGAMLFGRDTYELMEGAWPAVARDEEAPRAMREWAQKLEAKVKYVVSGSRSDFPWQNTIKVEGDLREAISVLNNSFADQKLMLRRTPEMITLAIDDYVVASTNDFVVKSYERFNAFVGYDLANWQFRVSAKNLTDNATIVSGSRSLGGFILLPPREWMATISYRM